METVDANISRLNNASQVSTGISALGRALQLTKNIMDNVAEVCSIIANRFYFPSY
jgi:hypothetical protein